VMKWNRKDGVIYRGEEECFFANFFCKNFTLSPFYPLGSYLQKKLQIAPTTAKIAVKGAVGGFCTKKLQNPLPTALFVGDAGRAAYHVPQRLFETLGQAGGARAVPKPVLGLGTTCFTQTRVWPMWARPGPGPALARVPPVLGPSGSGPCELPARLS